MQARRLLLWALSHFQMSLDQPLNHRSDGEPEIINIRPFLTVYPEFRHIGEKVMVLGLLPSR